MLPKKLRIDTTTFTEVFSRGRSLFASDLSLKFVLVPEISRARFAVVVSKKVDKGAVIRNKMRRAVYIAIGSVLERIGGKTKKPGHFIFLVNKPILDLPQQKLEEQIDFLIKNATI